MDNEIFLILQKFSIDVVVFSIITCAVCFLINKYASKKIKKFSLYYPYLFGVLLYLVYALIVGEKDYQKAFGLGITTGGVATILLSFIKSQNDKTTLAQEILRGVISEKNLDIVNEKINLATTEKEIADIICDYAVFTMTYDQCKVFAEIIAFSKEQE